MGRFNAQPLRGQVAISAPPAVLALGGGAGVCLNAHAMRIAFIRRNWSPTGGAEHYLVRLAARLTTAGHQCFLLCESWNAGPSDAFAAIESFPVESAAHARPRAFADAVNVRLHGTGETPFDLVFSLERGIRAHLYRAGDGVHREWLNRRRLHRPLTGWLRQWANRKNRVLLGLERATFHPRNTRLVIANSAMVRGDIERHFRFPAERIRVVPNGVDAARFASGDRAAGRAAMGWEEDDLVGLLVGAGAERKGHACAREAARRAGADVRLAIVDSPPPCSMPDLYAAADFFLLPTLYDPFANVTLEAMAAGLPVITTSANGGAEALRHGLDGFVVDDPGDARGIAVLVRALKDPELRRDMGARAKRRAADYGMDRHVAATLDVIQEAASLRGPSVRS